jgi:stress-induced morphogen
MEKEVITDKIRVALPDAQVELTDLTGTKDHWEARIISSAFHGKSLVQRHRMVFAALEEEMKGPIHALSLKVLTPEQANE